MPDGHHKMCHVLVPAAPPATALACCKPAGLAASVCLLSDCESHWALTRQPKRPGCPPILLASIIRQRPRLCPFRRQSPSCWLQASTRLRLECAAPEGGRASGGSSRVPRLGCGRPTVPQTPRVAPLPAAWGLCVTLVWGSLSAACSLAGRYTEVEFSALAYIMWSSPW